MRMRTRGRSEAADGIGSVCKRFGCMGASAGQFRRATRDGLSLRAVAYTQRFDLMPWPDVPP